MKRVNLRDKIIGHADFIQCLVCNRQFKSLGTHVALRHRMTLREYKLKFSLPLTVGLIGASTLEKFQGNKHLVPGDGERIAALADVNRGSGKKWKGDYHAAIIGENMIKLRERGWEKRRGKWRDRHLEFIKMWDGDVTSKKIAEHFGISVPGIKLQAKKLGLNKRKLGRPRKVSQ